MAREPGVAPGNVEPNISPLANTRAVAASALSRSLTEASVGCASPGIAYSER